LFPLKSGHVFFGLTVKSSLTGNVFITSSQVKNGVLPKYPFLPCGDCSRAIPSGAFGEKQTRPTWILFWQQTEKDRVKQGTIFYQSFMKPQQYHNKAMLVILPLRRSPDDKGVENTEKPEKGLFILLNPGIFTVI
jgi:hypothetical protein